MPIDFQRTISGFLAAVLLIEKLLEYFRNRREHRVVVSRIYERSRGSISDLPLAELRGVGKRHTPDWRVLNKLRISHYGDLTIEKLSLKIKVSSSNGPLKFWIADRVDPMGQIRCRKLNDTVKVTREFINPRCLDREEKIMLNILSSKHLTFSVVGSGCGWSSKFEDQSLPEGQAHNKAVSPFVWVA
jgi:hypothetical protein